MTKSYNGHKSWAHWNVSLWLFNEEHTYRRIKTLLSCNRTKDEVARQLLTELPESTPDGAKYTFTTVRAALVGQ